MPSRLTKRTLPSKQPPYTSPEDANTNLTCLPNRRQYLLQCTNQMNMFFPLSKRQNLHARVPSAVMAATLHCSVYKLCTRLTQLWRHQLSMTYTCHVTSWGYQLVISYDVGLPTPALWMQATWIFVNSLTERVNPFNMSSQLYCISVIFSMQLCM